jgi:hypothetical protein
MKERVRLRKANLMAYTFCQYYFLLVVPEINSIAVLNISFFTLFRYVNQKAFPSLATN